MSSRIRLFSFLVFVVLVVGAAIYGWMWVTKRGSFPIKSVQVVGKLHFIDKTSLQKRVLPYVTKGYFNVSVAAIRHKIMQVDGIKSVSITRVFPSTVRIKIKERDVLAFYEDGGLVSDDGIYFKPKFYNDLPALPVFNVPKKQLLTAVAMYNKLSTILESDQLSIAKLMLSKIGQWQLILSNQTIIYPGNKDVLARIKTFVKSYPALIARNKGKTLVSVDLRYHQGFAARWASS